MTTQTPRAALAMVALSFTLSCAARAAYTAVWFDGFDTSASSFDINFETGLPRQGGAGIPTSWVSNGGPSDYHDQVTFGKLLLAGDGGIGGGLAIASPVRNFIGLAGGEAIGTKIAYAVDPGTNNVAGRYSQSAVTIGSAVPLIASQSAGSHFSVRFVEDEFSGNGAFLQMFDGNTIVGNLIPNPAGYGPMYVELLVSDTDGNPWDGVGGTKIDVSVNGTPAGSYTKGGGGYTANYLTLEGSANFVGMGLETHFYDNLTVFSSPVPEPAVAALGGLGLLSLLRRRR